MRSGRLESLGVARCAGALVVAVGLASAAPSRSADLFVETVDASDDDGEVADLRELADGTFVVAGRSMADAWRLHVAADGTVIDQQFLGSGASLGHAECGAIWPDGDVFFAGHVATDPFIRHAWVARLAATGTVEWSRVFTTPIGQHHLLSADDTRDGGVVAAGHMRDVNGAQPRAWIVKLTATGAVEWQVVRGSGEGEGINDINQTADGGFVAVGVSGTTGPGDAWVVKLDSSGDVEWQRTFNGSGVERATGVAELPGGGYVVTATSVPTSGGQLGWVFRLDSSGGMVWKRVFGVAEWSYLDDATPTLDGGVLLLGTVGLPSWTTTQLWLVRIDGATGTPTWQRAFTSVEGTWGSRVVALSDGGILAGGHWSWFDTSDVMLVRADHEGRVAGCPGALDVALRTTAPVITSQAGMAASVTPEAVDNAIVLVTTAPSAAVDVQCEAVGCGTWPGEVSDVVRGEPPLRVHRAGTRLTFERVGVAVSYSAYVDAIGSWYAPSPATGSACDLTAWTDNGDGTLSLDFALPSDSWILLTAVSPCAEGPAGSDSLGRRRESVSWWLCGY